MRKKFIEDLVCPTCLQRLSLQIDSSNDENMVLEGLLHCSSCNINFTIKNGIPVFGISQINKNELDSEMDAENEWEFTTDIEKHLKWAEQSAIIGEKMINRIKASVGVDQKRVLDIASGIGAYHSWQLVKHNFEVVSTEVCPEFLFSINYMNKSFFFERIVCDGYVLPFREQYFDIIFCKEIIHHLDNPMMFLNELSRILKPNGIIAIIEPCIRKKSKNNMNKSKDKSSELLSIMHHHYTFNELMKFVNQIVSSLDLWGEMKIIKSSNHPLLSMIQNKFIKLSTFRYFHWLSTLLLRLDWSIRGGVVNMIGFKNNKYLEKKFDRKIIPIPIKRLEMNSKELEYFTKQLIPMQLKVFSAIHENISENSKRNKVLV